MMEVLLNLAWLLLAASMLAVWFKLRRSETVCPHCAKHFDKPTQFIALCVLLLILFPVISVSDDLLTAQYTTETDGSVRKHHAGCCPAHSYASTPANEALSAFQLPLFFTVILELPYPPNAAPALNPAFYSIENRPPPAAV